MIVLASSAATDVLMRVVGVEEEAVRAARSGARSARSARARPGSRLPSRRSPLREAVPGVGVGAAQREAA